METPRARFRAFLDSGDRSWVVPALAGSGLANMSSEIVAIFISEDQGMFATVTHGWWYGMLLFAPLLTVLCSWLNAFLLRFTGRWLGGHASTRDLFTALGWSVMPLALSAPLMAAEAVALVRGAADPEKAGGLSGFAGVVVNSFFGVAVVMSMFRLIISVSEAQGFGKWRAAGNFALAILPFLLLVLATGLSTGAR